MTLSKSEIEFVKQLTVSDARQMIDASWKEVNRTKKKFRETDAYIALNEARLLMQKYVQQGGNVQIEGLRFYWA